MIHGADTEILSLGVTMTDLNYKAPKKAEKAQPEDIVMGIIAVSLWVIIVIGWIGAA